jgi:hypothetical protein
VRTQVTNPIEPLMISLVKGFIDDDDLNSKLRALYQVVGVRHLLLRGKKRVICDFIFSGGKLGEGRQQLQAKT